MDDFDTLSRDNKSRNQNDNLEIILRATISHAIVKIVQLPDSVPLNMRSVIWSAATRDSSHAETCWSFKVCTFDEINQRAVVKSWRMGLVVD